MRASVWLHLFPHLLELQLLLQVASCRAEAQTTDPSVHCVIVIIIIMIMIIIIIIILMLLMLLMLLLLLL